MTTQNRVPTKFTGKLEIYRVETPRGGRGPYSVPEWMGLHEAHSDGFHPSPVQDGLAYMHPNEHCGFITMSDLHRWFKGWHLALAGCGFLVAVYLVPKDRVRFARSQIVFRRGDLLPFRSLPLAEP